MGVICFSVTGANLKNLFPAIEKYGTEKYVSKILLKIWPLGSFQRSKEDEFEGISKD